MAFKCPRKPVPFFGKLTPSHAREATPMFNRSVRENLSPFESILKRVRLQDEPLLCTARIGFGHQTEPRNNPDQRQVHVEERRPRPRLVHRRVARTSLDGWRPDDGSLCHGHDRAMWICGPNRSGACLRTIATDVVAPPSALRVWRDGTVGENWRSAAGITNNPGSLGEGRKGAPVCRDGCSGHRSSARRRQDGRRQMVGAFGQACPFGGSRRASR